MSRRILIAGPGGAVGRFEPEVVVAALVAILDERQRQALWQKLVSMQQAAVLKPNQRPSHMPTPAIIAP